MSGCVIVIFHFLLGSKRRELLEPLEFITFPYLTTEKLIFDLLLVKLDAIINLSNIILRHRTN